jgi:lipopolysaccharide transport system ATP-binding protein
MTNKAIFLEHGVVKFSGTSADALLEYRKSLHEVESKRLSQVAEHLKEKARQARVASQEKFSRLRKKKSLSRALYKTIQLLQLPQMQPRPRFPSD